MLRDRWIGVRDARGRFLQEALIKIIVSPAAIAAAAARARRSGKTVGFVPTMGALHEGHAALIRRARKENGWVAVSVFVNPKQFGPKEDLSRYPRPFAADAALCRGLGVDALFHPTVRGMYPPGFATNVRVSGVSETLEGARRPGHFDGVATVVLRLLQLLGPDRAYFGEKDWQQLQVVKRMVQDLGGPWKIVGCPTVRERDGVALSSRNVYLTATERQAAPALRAALLAAAERLRRGGSPRSAETLGRRRLSGIDGLRLLYFAVVEGDSMAPAGRSRGALRVLGAVRLRRTVLIDNLGVAC